MIAIELEIPWLHRALWVYDLWKFCLLGRDVVDLCARAHVGCRVATRDFSTCVRSHDRYAIPWKGLLARRK